MAEPEEEPIDVTSDESTTHKYVVVPSYSLNGLKRPDSEVYMYTLYINNYSIVNGVSINSFVSNYEIQQQVHNF